ncbi:hypothetical protein L0B53_19315 (plasmid) [Vibrio sp. SS-MA-C1-2]|uniref:hypothetical protein n=1 Tax=Vibrio sp. SS-MA-C1-2 TaxID=2908646 RepID=UPI001F2CE590|nr:hypothetical protein [Vibrio sp. SS-MA-C1-2]UJF20285.1 hypothetical protein L0B53_19315 [Vibrio sp. SS-MA-C1-2]
MKPNFNLFLALLISVLSFSATATATDNQFELCSKITDPNSSHNSDYINQITKKYYSSGDYKAAPIPKDSQLSLESRVELVTARMSMMVSAHAFGGRPMTKEECLQNIATSRMVYMNMFENKQFIINAYKTIDEPYSNRELLNTHLQQLKESDKNYKESGSNVNISIDMCTIISEKLSSDTNTPYMNMKKDEVQEICNFYYQ